MTTNCNRCHVCGTVLSDTGGDDYCTTCRRYRNYVSHGREPRRCFPADRATECPAVIRNVERRCNERLQALARRHPLAQGGR